MIQCIRHRRNASSLIDLRTGIIIACGLFFGVVIFPGLLAAAGEENEN